jgi:hypothetical protein
MTVQQDKPTWQEIAKGVQATRDKSIAQVEPPIPRLSEKLSSRVIDIPREILSPPEVTITESSAETLVVSLAAGSLTATAVAKAFLQRAAISQKLVS